jgi:hypothetical protein
VVVAWAVGALVGEGEAVVVVAAAAR